MFKSATIRLTVWYLASIMVLSLFFSGLLFQMAARELESGLERQVELMRRSPRYIMLLDNADFINVLQRQTAAGEQTIMLNLLLVNSGIFLLGGLASYFLARRTLVPIQQAHESQGRFTADASHELRTPLTAMKSEIEVSLRDKDMSVAEARELLSSNLEEIDKLQALAGGLLRLARQDASMRKNFRRLSAADLAADAIRGADRLIRQSGAEVTATMGKVQVKGDHASLVELLTILIENAIKYSPDRKMVHLSAGAGPRFSTIKVTDQGQGIKAADLPHIFDRFYRADSSRTRDTAHPAEGYGLGLSIARQIVELHSGSIEASSRPGYGTTFTIRLPAMLPAGLPGAGTEGRRTSTGRA